MAASTPFNNAKMSIVTGGTGILTLGSNIAGFDTFAGAGLTDGTQFSYKIEDPGLIGSGNDWEIGTGVTSGGVVSVTRTFVKSSTGSLLNVSTAASIYITFLAADLQSGTAAFNLLRLDGTAKIPAVDGSQLTNIGTAANQLVKLDGSAKLPAVDGSQLTNMTSSQLVTMVAGTGAGGDNVFMLNSQTVNNNYTIPTNYNATSTGPITIGASATVSLGSNSVWTIL